MEVAANCDHLSAQVLRYFLREAFTAVVFFAVLTAFALAFGVDLSSGVTNPIGRLCGWGGVVSSRSASTTHDAGSHDAGSGHPNCKTSIRRFMKAAATRFTV